LLPAGTNAVGGHCETASSARHDVCRFEQVVDVALARRRGDVASLLGNVGRDLRELDD
jgi:hypothetical protein